MHGTCSKVVSKGMPRSAILFLKNKVLNLLFSKVPSQFIHSKMLANHQDSP